MKRIRNYFLTNVTVFFLLTVTTSYSQNSTNSWSAKWENPRAFIENKGQFHIHNSTEPVLYAYDNGSTMIYFTSKGVTYSFLKRWKKEEDEKEHFEKIEDWKKKEEEERRMEYKTDVVSFVWENANPNTEVISLEETSDYHSYNIPQKDGSEKNINFIKGFKKIIYKELYPNIDVEYVFHPVDGIKYSLILHPGADVSQVKMNYSDRVKVRSNGELNIPTSFGDIIEHAPATFYSDNNSAKISSRFIRSGRTISFELGQYDASKTIVVDPWVQTPTLSNSNSVWECERDGAGNVYIIGGDMPLKLLKYNSAGAIQWTYNTTWDTANYWLGTFAVDLQGNSYVTSGTQSKLSKVNTSGSNVWTNNSIGGQSSELWNITFNCDQTRLIIGGTQGILTLRGAIFDIDVTNGNVVTTKIAGFNKALLLGANAPNEVRSICSAPNGNYYFLILDSIGRIGQNFTATTPFGFKTNSTYDLAYYNPSYRYDNAGIMAIKANKNFVYTQNGSTLSKRSLGTGAVITTISIPGGINNAGSFGNPGRVPGSSGIDIDSCGNVYVGSGNAVIKYDANLVQISSVTLPFTVFDVAVSINGDVIVAGSTTQTTGTRTGYIQSIASFAACNPMKLFCCIASIDPVGPFCSSNAAVNLTAVTPGGTWSGTGITNAATGTFNPTTAGIGTHTIYYTLACGKDSTTITVKACASLSVCKETNGNITVSGGTSPYTWQSQSTTTDCSSCPFQMCIPPVCNGTTVTVWTTFGSTATTTPPGTWPIRAVDNAGNISVVTSLVSLPACTACAPLTASTSGIVNVICFGQSTGSFSATTTGGTSPYNYTLKRGSNTVATFSNVSGSQNFTTLPAGTYTLNITDNGGCPGSTTIIITEGPAIVPVTTSGNAACGTSNGTISVTASGGAGSFTYSWSSGASTQTVSGLTAGTYTVTVIDGNNCTTTAVASVSNSPSPTINSLNGTSPLCNGNTNGSAVVSVSGGSGALTYSWSNNSSGVTAITGLSAGTYIVSVTDATGCTAISSVTITNPGALNATTSSTAASCGTNNGSASVTVTGGTGSYFYSWSPSGGTSQTASNLAAATYTVTITDSNNCSTTSTAAVTNPGGGTASAFVQSNTTCYGGNNGSANASMNGGTPSYTYSWSNGSTAATVTGLTADTYTVTITDANGCNSNSTVTIAEPSTIAIIITPTSAPCGTTNGSAIANAGGGTGSLSYSWSTGSTSPSANNLSAGTYTLTITDANGCSATKTTVITSTGGPTANAGNSVTIISGNSVTLNGSGTTGATFSWSPTSSLTCSNCPTPVASPTLTTTYTLTVTANGCSATDTVTVFIEIPCGDLFVPKAFSPNNDGQNEVLYVYGKCIKDLEFAIYDRWGEKVFFTTNPASGWDGTFRGNKLDAAVFVYYLKANVNGEEVSKHGNITLVK